jgi:hypothetical protein
MQFALTDPLIPVEILSGVKQRAVVYESTIIAIETDSKQHRDILVCLNPMPVIVM